MSADKSWANTESGVLVPSHYSRASHYDRSEGKVIDFPVEKQINDPTNTEMGGMLSEMRASPRLGTRDILALYSDMPWLRAVVGKVGKAVGSTTWTLFAMRGGGKQAPQRQFRRTRKVQRSWSSVRRKYIKQLKQAGELTEITEHPLLDLLSSFNPALLASASLQLTQMYIDLVGEAFWMIERTPIMVPDNLWPIPPTWVQDLPSRKKPFYEVNIDGVMVDVPVTEMIYFRDPDPMKPYGRGVGLARSLSDELATDEYAAKHVKNFFFNRARPDIIVSGKRLDKTSTERLRQKWEDEHQGFWRVFKPLFFSGEIDVKELSQSFQSMGLIELRKFERDTIVSVYGVPPEKIGIITSSNRASIQAADLFWNKDVILPRLEFQRMVMQEGLVPEFDDRLILDFESPSTSDREFIMEVMKAKPQAFTYDEWRAEAEYDSREEFGDVRGVPTSIIEVPATDPVESIEDEPEPDFDEPDDGEDDDEDQTPPEDEARAIVNNILRSLVTKISPRDVDFIVNAIKVQRISNFVFNAEEEVKKFGERRMQEIGVDISFDITDPRIVNFLRDLAGERITNINETTRKRIRRQLVLGIQEREDINTIMRRVRGEFRHATGRRALTIARTESVRAMNVAQEAATRQAGFKAKQWLSTRDERVRDTHDSLDGQIVNVDENFISPSGASGPHPGALGTAEEDINCRCTIISLLNASDAASPFNTEEKRTNYWKTNERARLPFEKQMEKELKRGFRKQEKEVIAMINSLSIL